MKPNEFRIGNLVLFKGKIHEVEVDTLQWMSDRYVSPRFDPIPLTEDWLSKFNITFGFSIGRNEYSIEYNGIYYDLRLDYDLGMSRYITTIQYVHQLQNLYFALTGKELKIKLDK